MADVLVNCEEKMKKSVESLKGDYDGLRTGRASASVLDKIKVDYYGVPTPINQVASVSVPEARSIVIQPWDKVCFPRWRGPFRPVIWDFLRTMTAS